MDGGFPDVAMRRWTHLVLRAFYAQFWLLQAFFKARDAESGSVSVRNLGIWSSNLTAWFVKSTPLTEGLVRPYTVLVPWIEIALGLLLLLGLWVRPALLASTVFLVSLCVGLMLQGKHDVVATNLVVMLGALLAAACEPWGRVLSVDAALRKRRRTPTPSR